MFIVITGLDGSGTSTVANKLHEMDKDSLLLRTPNSVYTGRKVIDEEVRRISPVGHMLYYLSSVVYMSDYIRKETDITKQNIYCVRYLIDTVVSNRVSGIDIDLEYVVYGTKILKPDLTIFVGIEEEIREKRISSRGKGVLDKVLDDQEKRKYFLENFNKYLPKDETIFFDNSSTNIDENITSLYQQILDYSKRRRE